MNQSHIHNITLYDINRKPYKTLVKFREHALYPDGSMYLGNDNGTFTQLAPNWELIEYYHPDYPVDWSDDSTSIIDIDGKEYVCSAMQVDQQSKTIIMETYDVQTTVEESVFNSDGNPDVVLVRRIILPNSWKNIFYSQTIANYDDYVTSDFKVWLVDNQHEVIANGVNFDTTTGQVLFNNTQKKDDKLIHQLTNYKKDDWTSMILQSDVEGDDLRRFIINGEITVDATRWEYAWQTGILHFQRNIFVETDQVGEDGEPVIDEQNASTILYNLGSQFEHITMKPIN